MLSNAVYMDTTEGLSLNTHVESSKTVYHFKRKHEKALHLVVRDFCLHVDGDLTHRPRPVSSAQMFLCGSESKREEQNTLHHILVFLC